MQIYTIKIVAGAPGQVPAIVFVGNDLTRWYCESFIYSYSTYLEQYYTEYGLVRADYRKVLFSSVMVQCESKTFIS